MNGIDEMMTAESSGKRRDCAADGFEAVAEAFSPVRCNQNDP